MNEITYNEFTLFNDLGDLWTIQRNLTHDLALGLVVATSILIDQLYYLESDDLIELPIEPVKIRLLTSYGDYINIENISDIDKYFNVNSIEERLSEYIDAAEEPGKFIVVLDLPNRDELESYEKESGSYPILITVNNMEKFLQGFISICNAFNVNFNNYIVQLPCDSNGIMYNIIN
jgi:hypothetical protein